MMTPPPESSADLVNTGSGRTIGVRVLLLLIRGYQLFVSPVLGSNCRYHPTCSAFAQEAILAHGLRRGGWLALRRVSRCHPWGGHGHDPVPESRNPELIGKESS